MIMKAGRELDALVAKIMGLQVLGVTGASNYEGDSWNISAKLDEYPENNHPVYLKGCRCEEIKADEILSRMEEPDTFGHYWFCLGVVPFYSTKIEDAWRIIARLEQDFGLMVHRSYYPLVYQAEFHKPHGMAEAATAPLAICLAALKAMEINIVEANLQVFTR